MKIRPHIGISVNGYVSTPGGRPTVSPMRDFQSGVSHGRLVTSGQTPLTVESQPGSPDGSIELVDAAGSRNSV